MKQIYIDSIAQRLGVRDWQVENCVKLFEEGATIPFISRYRKERTGGLDDVAVAEVRHWHDVFVAVGNIHPLAFAVVVGVEYLLFLIKV